MAWFMITIHIRVMVWFMVTIPITKWHVLVIIYFYFIFFALSRPPRTTSGSGPLPMCYGGLFPKFPALGVGIYIIYICVCMYACLSVWMCLCVSISCEFVCIYVWCIYVSYIHIWVSVYLHLWVSMCGCLHVLVSMSVCACVNRCLLLCESVYVFIWMYQYVFFT